MSERRISPSIHTGADRVTGPGVVLVTGASGFVGQAVVEALARDGWTVRALVRRPDPRLGAYAEPYVAADIVDREAIRRAVHQADAVVHLAARVHVMHDTVADPLSAFRAVNVEGTRIVAEEAGEAGVGTMVFASSVKTVAEQSPVPLDETVRPVPVDPYGVSKLEAEEVLRAMGTRYGMRTPVLRLPLVYGPGVRANMLQLFRAVERGLPLPFGAVRNRRSLVFVGNLAHGIQCALRAPAAHDTYFITDQDDLSTPALIGLIAQALACRARLIPIPPAVLRGVADIAGRCRWSPALVRLEPMLQRLVESLAFDASALTRVAGYHPPFTPLEGLRATAEWYRTDRAQASARAL